MLEQLIDAQLDFLDQQFSQSFILEQEWGHFYLWFRQQRLAQLWSFEQIYQLLEQQFLHTPISQHLLEHFAEQLRFALIHDVNQQTKIADLIPVLTVDKTAQYVASKAQHRQKLIHHIVNNPAFSAMMSQMIQQAIQDYLDNSVMVKHVPGVSRFMKMGKSVLENVTDSNLDDTIGKYLQKNILKISQMSESILNEHFDDEKLYHFQATLWHKIKDQPLSVLKNYIEVNDLPNTVGLIHEVWDHARQTDYVKQQLHDGLYAWYIRNQEQPFDLLLADLNINEALIQTQLQNLLNPMMQQCITQKYLRERARIYLEKFYYAVETKQILNLD